MLTEIKRITIEYARSVEYLGRDEDFDEIEAWQALSCRERLAQEWPFLPDDVRQRILSIDVVLVKKQAIIARFLPSTKDEDRSHWWWFLHEGPHVREEAEQLVKEGVHA